MNLFFLKYKKVFWKRKGFTHLSILLFCFSCHGFFLTPKSLLKKSFIFKHLGLILAQNER